MLCLKMGSGSSHFSLSFQLQILRGLSELCSLGSWFMSVGRGVRFPVSCSIYKESLDYWWGWFVLASLYHWGLGLSSPAVSWLVSPQREQDRAWQPYLHFRSQPESQAWGRSNLGTQPRDTSAASCGRGPLAPYTSSSVQVSGGRGGSVALNCPAPHSGASVFSMSVWNIRISHPPCVKSARILLACKQPSHLSPSPTFAEGRQPEVLRSL